MKKLMLLSIMLLFTLALVAAPALAAKPAPKSTGGVTAWAGSVSLTLNFTAQDHFKGVKGNVMYTNSVGGMFKGKVTSCYAQDENKAAFAGMVTDGTYAYKYFKIEVLDNGQGDSAEPDRVRVRLSDKEYNCSISGSFPGVVSEGNLQVH